MVLGGEHVLKEIDSQGDCWRRAPRLAHENAGVLPREGDRVAVVGCGTSWFMAQAYAALREASGHGETDAFAASEFPEGRSYDRVLAITRSGTTTEVLQLLDRLRGVPATAVTAVPDAEVADAADALVVLDFADETSVVQTRFATTALVMLRAHLGEPADRALADLDHALAWPIGDDLLDRRPYTFLGTGWTTGLAQEAALKMREASLSWSDAYPAMDYRHGPVSLTDGASLVWFLGGLRPDGLGEEVAALGATVVADPLDPVADLVRVQRLAVAAGLAKGFDPDRPRNLTRSVILP
jgi:fructoselysine-6-P-deglycase FrlB-like protein